MTAVSGEDFPAELQAKGIGELDVDTTLNDLQALTFATSASIVRVPVVRPSPASPPTRRVLMAVMFICFGGATILGCRLGIRRREEETTPPKFDSVIELERMATESQTTRPNDSEHDVRSPAGPGARSSRESFEWQAPRSDDIRTLTVPGTRSARESFEWQVERSNTPSVGSPPPHSFTPPPGRPPFQLEYPRTPVGPHQGAWDRTSPHPYQNQSRGDRFGAHYPMGRAGPQNQLVVRQQRSPSPLYSLDNSVVDLPMSTPRTTVKLHVFQSSTHQTFDQKAACFGAVSGMGQTNFRSNHDRALSKSWVLCSEMNIFDSV